MLNTDVLSNDSGIEKLLVQRPTKARMPRALTVTVSEQRLGPFLSLVGRAGFESPLKLFAQQPNVDLLARLRNSSFLPNSTNHCDL